MQASFVLIHLILICTLFSSGLAGENQLLQIFKSGSTIVYECIVVGEGSTVWKGSVFDCPSKNNSIIVTHHLFTVTNSTNVTRTCNNGTIIGNSVEVEGNCLVSRLVITIVPGLDRKNVTCIHNNGSSELIIGNEIIFLDQTKGNSKRFTTFLVILTFALVFVIVIGYLLFKAKLHRKRKSKVDVSNWISVSPAVQEDEHHRIRSERRRSDPGLSLEAANINVARTPRHDNQATVLGRAERINIAQNDIDTSLQDSAALNTQIQFCDHQFFDCDCGSQRYTLDGHDITISVPEGAVAEGEKVCFEVGVATYGPFNFPKNIQPVSPILWLYPREANVVLKKPLQVIIPHCLTGLTNDGLRKSQVCFIQSDRNGRYIKGCYHFHRYSNNNNFLFDTYGVLETLQFGLFGFAKLGYASQMGMSYCLAHIYLPLSPPTYSFHFCALYNLPTHKKELEKQITKRSVPYFQYTDFTFQHDNGGPFLKLHTSGIPADLEPKIIGEIKECDINFWGTDYQNFRRQLESGEYPPRIILTVRHNQSDSEVSYPVKFLGCAAKLELDLLLSTDAQLFEEAMQNGFVSMQAIVLLLIGVAGAGKTSFCHLILDEPPPDIRRSTPLAKSSIRAMSTSKAIVVTKAIGTTQEEGEGIIWKRVLQQDFRSLIADAIKESKWYDKQYQAAIPEKDKPKVSYLTALKHLEAKDFYKWMQRKRREEEDTKPPLSEQNIDSSDNHTTIQDMEFSKSNVDLEISSSDQIVQAESSCIKQLFESQSMQELFKLIAKSKGSVELLQQEWLYIIDTGGQPQFHELLPTFVHHVSAAAFFVKLNETLMDHPVIEYYDERGDLCGQPYESAHNHLQTIQNCLQAMQWRREVGGNPHCPELFFIGTHRDLENGRETVDSKNKCLKDELQQHDIFCRHLAYSSIGKSDQLLYPVNAKSPDKADKQTAANFRQDVMRRCRENASEYKIPIQWFILEMLLQDLSIDGVISYQNCRNVASRLKMDEIRLKAAIDYLIKLNIFEYFPTMLPNVVFTTSQVLLNKVTELVEYSHELRGGLFSNCDPIDIDFRDYGKITIKMLERKRFSRHYVKGLFEPKHLLKLLIECLVAAESPDGATMPVVLQNIPLEELSKYRSDIKSSNPEPIAIHYPGGLFPSGIFSCLVSHLHNKSKWKIMMEHSKPACLFKNCAMFSVSGEVTANVTLIYSHNWIELHATIFDEGQGKACICLLWDDLFEGLKHAETVQKCKNMQPEWAFFCDCQGAYYQHLARDISEKIMRCSVNSKVCKRLTEKQKLWLKSLESTEANPIPSLPSLYIFEDHHTPLNEHNHSVLYKQLGSHSAKWREIGAALGFLPSELEEIQARPPLFSGAPRSFLSAMLAEWLQWAPGDNRGSTSFATLEGLKFALRSIPELEIVAQNVGIPDY